MSPPAKPKREIGFHVKYDDDKPKSKQRRCPQPSAMNSQPISFLVQIKEIVDFEEELAGAKN
jgi:hypothetical protein